MKVLVVSGFLGAGKTTFIKQLIGQTKKKLAILENEYGENNLDSLELQKAPTSSGEVASNTSPLEVLEFMEGCICCSKKDSFVNTVLAISASLDPEYLVVEPTGVGLLSSILSNLKKIAYERIEILPPVVVLSPKNIHLYKQEIGEIYTDQIINAKHIVFSKIENETTDLLEQAKNELQTLNPNALIEGVNYKTLPKTWWDSLLETSSVSEEGMVISENGSDAIKQGFDQLTLHSGSFKNITSLIVLLEDILRGNFGQIYRAKGVLKVGREWIRFDLADQLYGIIREEREDCETQLVFIGLNLNKLKLRNRLVPMKLKPISRKGF